MGRCQFCRKKAGLNLIGCKSCENQFCTRCIDLSIHECDQLEKCKEKQRKNLEKSLVNNKTVDKKIISI